MPKTNTDAATDVVEASQTEAAEPENTLGHILVVRHAFGNYRKGDAIRDEATIREILARAENAHHVHKVLA